MKSVCLVRHAKSSWKDITLSDIDRPLNKRGKHDAPMMAEKLKESGFVPDMILSSPAKRARKTAKHFGTTYNLPVTLDERLYEADTKIFETLLREAFEQHDHVMLVSHNPGLTCFNDVISNIPLYNIPTAGIVCIAFPTQNAADTLKGKQQFFIYPKMYA